MPSLPMRMLFALHRRPQSIAARSPCGRGGLGPKNLLSERSLPRRWRKAVSFEGRSFGFRPAVGQRAVHNVAVPRAAAPKRQLKRADSPWTDELQGRMAGSHGEQSQLLPEKEKNKKKKKRAESREELVRPGSWARLSPGKHGEVDRPHPTTMANAIKEIAEIVRNQRGRR